MTGKRIGRRVRGDRGSVTMWVLVLTMMVVVPISGIAFDLWHSFSSQRALTSAADAAAQSGAAQLDGAAFRAGGVRQLDPEAARQAALDSLAARQDLPNLVSVDVEADTDHVVVTIHAQVPLGFLGLLAQGPIDVTVVGTSDPVVRP